MSRAVINAHAQRNSIFKHEFFQRPERARIC
nr:MAG TPA: hypothetical protein [Caudoviricetes sp.]